jgi:membrane-associated phospholipid phosphatase
VSSGPFSNDRVRHCPLFVYRPRLCPAQRDRARAGRFAAAPRPLGASPLYNRTGRARHCPGPCNPVPLQAASYAGRIRNRAQYRGSPRSADAQDPERSVGVGCRRNWALGRRDLTRTSVRVVEAVLLTKAVTGFAKSFVNRSRPFARKGPLTADPGEFDGKHSKLSMPSGHTARAFAVASVLAHQADRRYVSVLAYGGAASVGLERVRSGDHWLTDVVVGGTLGYLIGRSLRPRVGWRRDVHPHPFDRPDWALYTVLTTRGPSTPPTACVHVSPDPP